MSANDNVERAFPVEYDHGQGGTVVQFGMSLRDYFAAKAMQSAVSASSHIDMEPGVAMTAVARVSYEIADAMLAERSK